MTDKLTVRVKKYLETARVYEATKKRFLNRLEEGNFSIDENPKSHFTVFFAAYDPKEKKYFLGHHKRSGLWLFNGGHIDKGESFEQALKREMMEEWGQVIESESSPSLLTVTEMKIAPTGRECTEHYDIWFRIPVSMKKFNPDKERLGDEFFINKWVDMPEALSLVTDPVTKKALNAIF